MVGGDGGEDGIAALRRRIAALEAENARLREAEELARSVLENAPDAIARVTPDLKLVYVNRSADQGGGPSAIGRDALDFVLPEGREATRAALEHAVRTGERTEYDCIAGGLRGDVAHYHTRAAPIREGDETVALVLIATDVSRLKSTERALRESEQNLRFALSATGMGLWTWLIAENRVEWDATTCRLFGVEAPPATYEDYVALLHPEDRPRCVRAIERFMRTGVYEDIEHRIVQRDGTVRRVLGKGIVVRDDEGNAVRFVGAILDLTERKLLEEQLRQAQKMEAIGQMSAGIAHNFNNMLAAIVPSVEAAAKRADPSSAALLEAAREAAQRAAQMIRELMLFAGKSRAARDRRPERLDAIARRTVEMCRTTFDRGIALDVTIADDLPPVAANAGQIEQALLNVLLNARDAIEERRDGPRRLTIGVELVHGEALATLGACTRLPHVVVRVEDTGCGMDEETRRRAFEPFFTTKDVGKGTGLGLATTYGIVKDHDGFVACTSERGVGTTIRIAIPASSGLVEDRRDDRGTTPPAGNETVLLVDDEAIVRVAVGAVLRSAGYRVVEAVDGVEALEVIASRTTCVDVVLLDGSMPRLSGKDVLARLRNDGVGVPVVAFTGRAEAFEGATRVLDKPATTSTLLRVLRDAIDARGVSS